MNPTRINCMEIGWCCPKCGRNYLETNVELNQLHWTISNYKPEPTVYTNLKAVFTVSCGPCKEIYEIDVHQGHLG